MEQQKTFSIPFFVSDENCNFVPEILPRIHTKFLKDVLIADSYNSVCWANSFIPMPIQTLEQIMVLITKFKFSRSRDFLFPVFRLAVHINRYHTGKQQIRTMVDIMKSLFNTETSMRRLDDALMTLFATEQTSSYMTNIALSLHENGFPDSKFLTALKMIYRTGNSFQNQRDEDMDNYSEKLKTYNYLLKIPKYTLKSAVDVYNENIKDLSIGIQRQPTLLFTSRNDTSLKNIYNDILFLVSTWNMIFNYKKEQRRLLTWIKYEINSIMENVVLTGFQLPDLKEMILDLSALISTMNLLKKSDDYSPHLKLIINKLFEIGVFVTKSYISILPSFVKSQLISFEGVLRDNQENVDITYLLTTSKESDDEYDEDKLPRQIDPERVDNILMEQDFFNVNSENAFSEIALMPIAFDKIMDVEDPNVQVLEVELSHISLFVYSAIAQKYDLPFKEFIKRLKMTQANSNSGNSTPTRTGSNSRNSSVISALRSRSITPTIINRSSSNSTPHFSRAGSPASTERRLTPQRLLSGSSTPVFFSDSANTSPTRNNSRSRLSISPARSLSRSGRFSTHSNNEIRVIESADEEPMNIPHSPQSIYTISSYISTDEDSQLSMFNSPLQDNESSNLSEMTDDTE
ncbi:tegument protein UL35 [macacine betaherpesvirus 9]|uniref:Tegument protein UL35 n=1 Tax=macacine betaherpesvirus 9 TaxID=2560568 RepID=A0A191S3T0_9BETA|nr:tegument protein UL35 [macacine betaherpesvirus 9]ANC96535.1 tegument protein UL35 [macacine betaherpesvirus 9]